MQPAWPPAIARSSRPTRAAAPPPRLPRAAGSCRPPLHRPGTRNSTGRRAPRAPLGPVGRALPPDRRPPRLAAHRQSVVVTTGVSTDARGGGERQDCCNRVEEWAMSFEEAMGTVQGLLSATDALAAIG